MRTQTQGSTLIVSGLTELNATNAAWFRDLVRSSLTEAHESLDLDLSNLSFMDSDGIGALIAIEKTMRQRNGKVRLLNLTPTMLQLLQTLRLTQFFETISSCDAAA